MAKQNLTFEEKVIAIQNELKAPKNQYNSFGKYKYRSQEDILEAVKPLLQTYSLGLMLTDEVKELECGVIYVEARAVLHSGEGRLEVTAQAGIDINKKGMDISQTFGSSSSYARKYALNGLFLIDDTKDADSTNTHDTKPTNVSQPSEKKKPWLNEGTPEFTKAISYMKEGGDIDKIKEKYSVSKVVQDKLLTLN